MKTKILLLVVIASIIFTACKKDDDDKPAETTPTEQATLFNKKWVQQKWYRDSVDGEILNTVQTWEFLNDSVIKRTVSFPNTTEYQTYSIYDKWEYRNNNNSLRIETDSMYYLRNDGGLSNTYGTTTYDIITFTNTDLIIEWSYLPYYHDKYIFKAE